MKHNEIYLSLEISEHSIKAIVGEYFESDILVLASYLQVYDLEKESVKSVLENVRNNITSQLGYDMKNTILVMPSNYTKKYSDKIRVDAINYDQVITKDEIASGIDGLIKKNDNKENFVVNVLVDKYSAYGYGYVSNPVGLETRYIEMEASVYTIPTEIAYPLIKLVEESGFNVVDVCLDIIALSQEVTLPTALKSGAIIVDMNFESTNVAHFKNSTLKSYSSIDIGGKRVSEDIALCSVLSFEKAEQFKLKYVNLNIEEIHDLTIYRYYDEVNNEEVEITQKYISEVAKSRVSELITLLNKELISFNVEDGEIVYFCSGANNINGLDNLLKKEFKFPYQIATSKVLGARSSMYSKCLGAIRHVAIFSRTKGEIKLFVNVKEYIESINLVENNNLLYNNSDGENDFIKRLVSYIFNN